MMRDKEAILRIENIDITLPGQKIEDLDLERFGRTLLLAIRSGTE